MKFDCVIAGAGPSACACALILRQVGLSVCLVAPESEVECEFSVGESLPGAAIALLNRVGIGCLSDILSPFQVSACTGNVSSWGSEIWHRSDAVQNPQGGGWHVDRTAFNRALMKCAQQSGVMRINSKLANAMFDSSWKISLENTPDVLDSRFLLDATGRASVVSRLVGFKKQYIDSQTAVVAWLESAKEDKEQLTRIKAVHDGWWYSARLPMLSKNGLPVRVVAKFSLPKTAKKTNHEAQFLGELNESNVLPVRWHAKQILAPLQLKDASVSRLERFSDAKKGFLAIGDAVLSFDPLSSQGMFFALYSGTKAAESVLINYDKFNNDFAGYDRTIESVFHANQKSRKLYYASEHRFADSAFWQTKFA
ncbi:NAD(P)/FAD-dependent oxidoreductase [Pseudoalteromonas xiamenensis]|uniref:NAD(P)/FAD-dependent oxidoreductase n=1 Tax=Pseudoalteromonas xiamenensis TaxID=882626 RepID=UPI0027E5B4B1|nr:NAD(P)/FAD-dependent oxidoreductase [Pseudoalteromonas xiamenensis]WMN60859.1 NAD(P)/FAD-dependent oxidoreductase [Pseudoalteromonas xiamenensis]